MIRNLVLSLLILLPLTVEAQLAGNYRSYEAYVGLGSTHYFGEVGGSSGTYNGLAGVVDNLGIDWDQSRMNGIGGLRFEFRKDMAIRAGFNAAWISGDDKYSAHRDRGYAFEAIVVMLAADYEYYIARRMTGVAPYLSAGLGASVYRWKKKESNSWTRLLYSPGVRFGLGSRIPSRGKITQSIEVQFNYMITDYLDGINGSRDIGDTFYMLTYAINFELDKTFLYDHRGLIK